MMIYLILLIIIVPILLVFCTFLFFRNKKLKERVEEEKKSNNLYIDEKDIVITKALDKGNVKAFVTIKINEKIVLKDMRIIAMKENDKEKLKIEVPARITNRGHLLDIYQFVDFDFRQKLYDIILKKYKNL